MADDLGRKPIAGIAEASERRHPTRLPILVCQRKPGPQVDGAVHHATIFEMNVESYRRRAALDRKRGRGRPPIHATTAANT
jgi:hypothetical protein